jgi:hypothetical protein
MRVTLRINPALQTLPDVAHRFNKGDARIVPML